MSNHSIIFKDTSGLAVIQLTDICRIFPESYDFWDGNWINANVSIDLEYFKAEYPIEFQLDNLVELHRQMLGIYNFEIKRAQFEMREHGLYIEFTVERNGGITCTVEARYDQACLGFIYHTDFAEIQKLSHRLEKIAELFPLRLK